MKECHNTSYIIIWYSIFVSCASSSGCVPGWVLLMTMVGWADRISSWSQWRQGRPEQRTAPPPGLSGRSKTSSLPHSWTAKERKKVERGWMKGWEHTLKMTWLMFLLFLLIDIGSRTRKNSQYVPTGGKKWQQRRMFFLIHRLQLTYQLTPASQASISCFMFSNSQS